MAKVQSKEERDKLFAEAPIGAALKTMAIPTIIANLINLIYTMADTYFVGQTGNPYMIASISLVFTLFLFMIPISGLFGIGGGSYISRLLGVRRLDKVKHVSAFSFYAAFATAAIYSAGVFIFMEGLLNWLGASPETLGYAKQYVLVVVVIGTTPTVLSQTLAHLLRNTGYAKQASFGLSMGGVINMILDPLFMFVLFPDGYQVMGAAAATTLSNFISMVYFIVIFAKTKKETSLSLNPKDCLLERGDVVEVIKVGIPSAATTLLMDLTNMYMIKSMAAHGDLQLAAIGIETKIERLSNSISLGLSQAMLPLVAFNYSAKNYDRMKAFIKRTRLIGLMVAVASICFYQVAARPLIALFISNRTSSADIATTIAIGVLFLRIRCFASLFGMLNFTATNAFQAMGDGRKSLVLALVRQVISYFPLMIILDKFFGEVGLVLAFPLSEIFGAIVSGIMLKHKTSSLN